jgi:hypothetical protein
MLSDEDYNRFKRRDYRHHSSDKRAKRDIKAGQQSKTSLLQKSIREQPSQSIDHETRPHGYNPRPKKSSDTKSKSVRSYGLSRRRIFLIATSGLLVILIAGLAVLSTSGSDNPIPNKFTSNLGFTAYYPSPSNLPSGYHLDKDSFNSPAKDVLVYTVSSSNTHLTVSLQNKPSSYDLAQFVKQHLALNTTLATSVGVATIGSLNDETVASLPTNKTTWIIVSSQNNVSKSVLDTLLKSFKS